MMIKFMYNGEIKVQEAQLDDLLAAAETLQVKGLSNVRTKYEKGEIQSQSIDKNPVPLAAKGAVKEPKTAKSDQSAEKIKSAPPDAPRVRKRRKMSHTVVSISCVVDIEKRFYQIPCNCRTYWPRKRYSLTMERTS